VRGDEILIDPVLGDQFPRDAVKQHQIALGGDRQMLRGVHRRFGSAGIDHDDLRPPAIAEHPLPQDRMREAQIRTDEHQGIGLLEVRIGERRRVEAERLLVGRRRGGHALPRVGIAVDEAHAELEHGPQQRHLLCRNLPGAEERDRLRAVLLFQPAELPNHPREGRVPRHRLQPAAVVPQQRRGGPVARLQNFQRLPPFGTCHPQIDRILRRRGQSHGKAVLQMHIESATGGAVAAGHRRGGGWPGSGGDEAQAEVTGAEQQFAREWAVGRVQPG